ncbi:DUF6415 family natural product biosynthesis protein [Streptomyces sp. NPDC001970]
MQTATHDTAPPAEMHRDTEMALALSEARPTGPAAEAVRERLKDHLRALAGPAERYAATLGDDRARDIAQATIRHARDLAQNTGGDPAAMLRLLAKAVTFLLRYSQAAQRATRSSARNNREEHHHEHHPYPAAD